MCDTFLLMTEWILQGNNFFFLPLTNLQTGRAYYDAECLAYNKKRKEGIITEDTAKQNFSIISELVEIIFSFFCSCTFDICHGFSSVLCSGVSAPCQICSVPSFSSLVL